MLEWFYCGAGSDHCRVVCMRHTYRLDSSQVNSICSDAVNSMQFNSIQFDSVRLGSKFQSFKLQTSNFKIQNSIFFSLFFSDFKMLKFQLLLLVSVFDSVVLVLLCVLFTF